MATYVLVHGGGRGGWCCQPVARRLRGAGRWSIDTGHDLVITKPAAVTSALVEVAGDAGQ
ncbi:hypothetical protein Ga0074812_103235 [Parafrankia irregularis]|uniref:Alpha/beta hydrolase family protein n=1 Tax=Parafrankia irregularis TaxID=795642 RepID=A0A0S4QHM4_9ACTN|nr:MULTISPECIES: hypothetical protein [Parafrankia]CUU54745.1 hypothetical protein Ga0074812_103235 [Parafrankia irregularis]